MGLILPQLVEVNINGFNLNYYKELGYNIPTYYHKYKHKEVVKSGTKIIVHVLDLPEGSHIKVKVQCDNCGKLYELEYRQIINNYGISKIQKMFCKDCFRQSFAKENISPIAKYNNKEYMLEKIKEYIDTYGDLKEISKNSLGRSIFKAVNNYNYDLHELCNEIGYNYEELAGLNYPRNYFDNFDNIKNILQNFINKNGYFPSNKQIHDELNISLYIIQKHGGKYEIMRKMGIKDNKLQDDSGFYNRSYQEYILAQFLIHNNISYLREQHPFPDPYRKKRSDFTFILKNNEVYHLEIWGCDKVIKNSSFTQNYMDNRKLKESLYKKYNINLISIEPDTFNGCLETVQNKLKENLSIIFNNELKNIGVEHFIDPNDMSNDKLIKEVMSLSNDGNPPLCHNLAKEKSSIFCQIIKRYGSYNKFLIKNSLKPHNMAGIWSKDIVLNRMIQIKHKLGYMPKPNDILKNKMYKDEELFVGLHGAMKKCFEAHELAYIEFYKYCKINNIKLNDLDKDCMEYIYNKIKKNYNYLLNKDTIKLFKII